jgi:general secretion pathway protein M
MRASLSPRLRRLLAVALLVATAALLWSAVVSPLLTDYADAQATIEHMRSALDRGAAAKYEIGSLRAELADLKKRQLSDAGFIDGATESIAAAQLQNRVKTAVDSAKGELRSTQVLPARDDGKYRRITVRGQVLVTTAGLLRVLHDLESAWPYLFLDNVEIKAQPLARDRDAVPQDPTLEIRFDVSGLMRRSA